MVQPWRACAHVFLLLCAATLAHAQPVPAPRDVAYPGTMTLAVDATDVDHRVIQVRETLPVRPGRLTLLYPLWIPGTHGPVNEGKRLAGLRITGNGQPIAWTRDTANMHAFHVDVPAGVDTLDIAFQQVLGGSVEYTASYLSGKTAVIKWEGLVLNPAGWYVSRLPVDVKLTLPKGFRQASALRVAGTSGDTSTYERVTMETLVDSPVFAGPVMKSFDLDPGAKRPVVMSVFADDPKSLETTDEQVAAHRAMLTQMDRLYGARHFAHYDLLMILADDERNNFGLEHHQSSENAAKAGYFTDWNKLITQRYILPHEFSHSWNGKFRRPRDLWAPDFNTPSTNTLLWMYEGQTEYWGEVLASRAGMYTPEQARERIARVAAWHQAVPGRLWRNLQDTTNDEILAGRGSPLDWYSYQRFEDYYDEMQLVWLDADTRIREMSGGRKSLDDFARAFFGMEDGRVTPLLYDFDEIVATLNKVQPYDWKGFLRSRLDATGPLPLDGLTRSGWRLVFTDQQGEFAKAAAESRESTDFWFSLGLTVKDKNGEIRDVLWNGPAFKAGVGKDWTLLAVNMTEYKPEVLKAALATAKTDPAPIQLLLKRGTEYRVVAIDYHDGERYPQLERIEGTPDLLSEILAPRS